MRVISGKLKGKKLLPINELKIRPTSDRSKESIFNTLNSILIKKKINLKDMVVLDGFCGSGALGIEAFSRGAKKIYFIGNCIKSLTLAKNNCSITLISSLYGIFGRKNRLTNKLGELEKQPQTQAEKKGKLLKV